MKELGPSSLLQNLLMTNNYSSKRQIKIFLTILFFVLISGYIYFQSRNLITGPKLVAREPLNGASVTEPVITVSGEARNIAFITLNNNQIFVDDSGTFKEKIVVSEGYSKITISAKDRFNNSTSEIIEIFRPRTEKIEQISPESGQQENDLENSENLGNET